MSAEVRGPAGRPGSARALPYLAFTVCTLVWGSTFLFIRMGNDTVAPVWGAALRLALASVLLGAIAVVARQPWPRGATLAAAVGFGVVDFGISLPLLYWGEKFVPSAVAAILYACMPLLTAGFARLAGLEPIRPLKLVAGFVGLAGVAVLVSSEVHGHLPALRLLAVFLGAVTASLAGVILKRAPNGSPVVTNAIAHAAGLPFCVVASLLLRESQALPRDGEWLPIAYLTVVGSVIAFVTFAWLVQRWTVMRISFIAVITPVIATALGAAVRHERLGPTAAAGAAIVLAGVSLAIWSDARDRTTRPR